MAEHEMTLEVGQQFEVTLQSAGSAGYGWRCALEGDQDTVSVTRVPVRIPPPSGPESYSVPERFSILAQAVGECVVVFSLRRPWDAESVPPRQEVRYRLRVA